MSGLYTKHMKIVGIAGGSGAGKSAVAYALQDADPDKIEVLNFDDYQYPSATPNLPTLHGMTNWDDPEIIDWQKLLKDLKQLKSGQSLTIETRKHRSNSNYAQTRQPIPRTIEPKPILIVEGYLALYNPEVRALYDTSFYLDIDQETRLLRRDKGKLIGLADYDQNILIPMHAKYVEPTKAKADHVINTNSLSIAEICEQIQILI
jgi:uridine kinase